MSEEIELNKPKQSTIDFIAEFKKRTEEKRAKDKELIRQSLALKQMDKSILNDEKLQNARNAELGIRCESFGYHDTVDGGQGSFGLSRFNPIPVNGVIGELAYLSSLLEAETKEPIIFQKVKTVCVDVDEYELVTVSKKQYNRLYFDKRYEHQSKLVPEGYIRADEVDALRGISEGGKGYPFNLFSRENLYDSCSKISERYFGINYADVALDKFYTSTISGSWGYYIRSIRKLSKFYSLKKNLNDYACLIKEQIEDTVSSIGNKEKFYWIKDRVLNYSFDFTAFTYGGKTYSVIVDLLDDSGNSLMPWEQKELQILNCEMNRLVPLKFKIYQNSKLAYADGWNLYYTDSDETIEPTLDDKNDIVFKSNWEVFMLAQNYALKAIEDRGYTVLQTADGDRGIPQIRFETPEGTVGWCNINVNINDHKQRDRDLNIEETFKFLGGDSFGHCVEVYIDIDGDEGRNWVPRNGNYHIECSELLRVKMKGNKVIKFFDNTLF